MFVGIDLGTSAVKALLIDDRQQVVGSARVPLSPDVPRPGWSEDDPEKWWHAVDAALCDLRSRHAELMPSVRAIGLSGQMHACLMLDASDRPVRPAILWNDGRSAGEAREMAGSAPHLAARLGVPPSAGFTAPKIKWLARHEPALLDQVVTLLLPKDYLLLQMTGQRATDRSDAAGTWLLDQATRDWSPEAVELCGVDPQWLPPLRDSTDIGGALRAGVAERWGVPPGTPVACGGGDTAVGGVGIGAVNAGEGFVSLGTSAQIFIAQESFTPAPERLVHAFCHAVPDRWYAMAALLNGASVLSAAASLTGSSDVAAVLRRVEAAYDGPSPLLALPYLMGERTPHDDPAARGCLFGLTANTRPEQLVQAMLEGVAFSLADGMQALAAAGAIPSQLGLIGGGARSAFWASMIADILDIELVRYVGAEHGPAFGAARLARLAVTGEAVEDVAVKPVVERTFVPDAGRHQAYAPRLEAFRRLYAALAPEFHTQFAAAGRGDADGRTAALPVPDPAMVSSTTLS